MKKKILLSIALILSLNGCKNGCEVEDKVSSGVAGALAKTLECKNVTAIESDIKSLLDKTGICQKQGGIVGSLVCPELASLVISELGNKLPKAWECNPVGAEAVLSTLAGTACSLIPF